MSRFKIDNGQGNGFTPGAYYKQAPDAVIDPKNEENLVKWEANLQLDRKTLLEAIKVFGPVVRDIRRGLVNQKSEAA